MTLGEREAVQGAQPEAEAIQAANPDVGGAEYLPDTNPPATPNILLVFLDDVGLEPMGNGVGGSLFPSAHAEMGLDVSATGISFGALPTIEALATAGARCSDVWTSSRCSPSRAGMLTGRYPLRTKLGIVVREDELLDLGDPSLSQLTAANAGTPLAWLLRARGYKTGVFGKWHLNLLGPELAPDGVGGYEVDESVAILGFEHYEVVARNLYDQITDYIGGLPPASGGFAPGYWNFWAHQNQRTPTQVVGTHATEWTCRRAKAWIDARNAAGERWFCYLPVHACHSPFGLANDAQSSGIQADGATLPPPGSWAWASNWQSTLGGLEHCDNELANLLTSIDWSNTVLVMLGDNGMPDNVGAAMLSAEGANIGSAYTNVIGSGRLKSTIYTAGVRNWLIARGVGVSARATEMACRIDAVDVYATLREWARADVSADNLDGISFAAPLAAAAAEAGHQRAFHWTENFEPNGDPTQLVAGGTTPQVPPFQTATHAWDRAVELEHSGTRYKLHRALDGTEEFYNYSTDPYEQSPLALSGAAYAAASAKMDEILGSI